MKILVLIPAYNEGERIYQVAKEVKELGHDVLVIDDGSDDNTLTEAKRAGVKILRHYLNRGQGAALKTGLKYALGHSYEAVAFFDADGQMAASEIKKLTEPIRAGKCEVVLGSRFLGRAIDIPVVKLITLKLALWFTQMTTGLTLSDVHNGFQVWSRSALEKLDLSQDRQAYASELLHEIADKKLKYQEMPVTIKYTDYSRAKGQSIFNAFGILWDLLIKK